MYNIARQTDQDIHRLRFEKKSIQYMLINKQKKKKGGGGFMIAFKILKSSCFEPEEKTNLPSSQENSPCRIELRSFLHIDLEGALL